MIKQTVNHQWQNQSEIVVSNFNVSGQNAVDLNIKRERNKPKSLNSSGTLTFRKRFLLGNFSDFSQKITSL